MTKLPRLYVNDKFTRLVHPVSVSITENIVPLSTASINLPRGEELPARSYVELFNPYGSAGMYRVRSPHNAYGDDASTAELEHMISEVGDYLVKDEISEMIGASTAVAMVFSHYRGAHWQLGSYSAIGNDQIALEVKYESVLNVLLAILEQKPDCMMAFDFSTTPWRLNIVKRGTSVVAEGRLSRNVTSATVTYDDSELYTRVWYQTFSHDDEGNVNNSWNYRDADTKNTYGIIEGRVNTSADMTGSEINKTVNEFIRSHKHPKTSVMIQAAELAHITGERIDRFLIGDLMRLALPDYNLTVELNITSIVWGDVYNNPDSVSIHLGEEEDTVVTFLHNLDSKGSGSGSSTGRGGGGAAGKEAEFWSVYKTLTDEYGKILKEAGIYLDAEGTLIYAQDTKENIGSKFNVQAQAITAEVERASNAETVLSGNLSVEHNRITAEVAERKNGDEILSGRITVEKNRITQEVNDRTSAVNTLSGRITVEAGKINQIVSAVGSDGQVTAASICLAINSGGSSATINADKIYLLGQTIANTITADYIDGKIATLSTMHGISASFSGNVSASGAVMGSGVYIGSGTSFQSVAEGIKLIQVVPDGNNYKLQYQKFNSDGWVDASTFSRATTLSGAWSGGKFTVNASPQGKSFSTTIVQGTATWNGNSATVPIEAIDSDNPGYQYATGRSILVDASGRYNAGYDAGWNACRTAMLNSADRLSYYTGTVTTKYDAPSVGATARQVIYPYTSHTTTLYTVPDRR